MEFDDMISNTKLSDEIATWDATAVAEAIANGRFTSCEIVEAYYVRIQMYNKSINAIVTCNKQETMSEAKKADIALLNGKNYGPFHGVPITIKDSFETKRMKTTVSCSELENYIPENDADVVEIVKNAGAIVLGKTNCPSMCLGIQTKSPIFGVTSNPWDIGRTSGGSSGGEAAAIASGLSPLGIGSDTGGSIRIPSSYCGIYGLKPTCRKIPKRGHIPPMPGMVDMDNHLTVAGPMARSIRDLQLFLHVMTGERIGERENKQELRIAWTVDFSDVPLDDEIKEQIICSAAMLERNGVNAIRASPAIDLRNAYRLAYKLAWFEFNPNENSPFLKKLFWKTLFKGGTFKYYKNLLMQRNQMIKELDTFLSEWDCWLLPVTPTTAFPHIPQGQSIPINQNGKEKLVDYYLATTGFAIPFNFTGHPSVTIPIGRDKHGMPVAVQLLGKHGCDMELLNIANIIDGKIGGIKYGSCIQINCIRKQNSIN